MRKLQKSWLLPLGAAIAVIALVIGLVFFRGGTQDDSPIDESAKLYVDPGSNAAAQARNWEASRPDDAAAMARLAALPMAKWLTSTDSLSRLDDYLRGAALAKASPVLVVYNIPNRDCGLYSAGGVDSDTKYRNFIDDLARRLTMTQSASSPDAFVIIEPDALPNIKSSNNGKACLTATQQQQRYDLLGYSVKKLNEVPKTALYIDAGNSAWIRDTDEMAQRLREANVENADGFSLNVSNFQTTVDTETYGRQLSAKLDGKHYVIDTSRNGNGPFKNPTYPEFNWCNPPERALGHYPTVETGLEKVDAFLYVKIPGESDGQDPDVQKCFGGPQAGQWHPDYALGLIKRWPKELQPR